jgi:hypothetical protein
MGDPEDDQDLRAPAATDATLAGQDGAAADGFRTSAENLNSMASTLAEEGYADAAAGLLRAASHELAEGVPYALQGEYLQEAAKDWGAAADAVDHHAKDMSQALVGAGERLHAYGPGHDPASNPADHAKAAAALDAVEQRMQGHRDEADRWAGVAQARTQEAFDAESAARTIHPGVPEDPVPLAPDPAPDPE